MSLVKWNRPRIVPSFSSLMNGFLSNDFDLIPVSKIGFSVPAVNIVETENEFTLELAAPGKSNEDFVVDVENGVLTINSESKEETVIDEKNYTRQEYSYHSFRRSFNLPENVESDHIDAKYENGILQVTIPKKEVAPLNKKTVAVK